MLEKHTTNPCVILLNALHIFPGEKKKMAPSYNNDIKGEIFFKQYESSNILWEPHLKYGFTWKQIACLLPFLAFQKIQRITYKFYVALRIKI